MPPCSEVTAIGQGSRRETIVFLHPGLGSARSWGRFPELLCSASGRPGLLYTREEYDFANGRYLLPEDFVWREADRLEQLLSVRGIERPLLVGSSDGATISLVHAARFPQRAAAAVSIAAHVVMDPQMPIALERIRIDTASNPPPEWLMKLHGERGPRLGRAWCETWKVLMDRNWNLEVLLGKVRCPVLAMQGENDENGLPQQLDAIQKYVPQATVRLLQGLGHFPFREDPESLVDLINRFIAEQALSKQALS
jgi:pimeloyl-ACP methyl ester carboxylesterase